jgi:predicted  nucleic acid-binding Zn-ribbon protein
MSSAFKLYRLQQVDSQLDQIHARLAEIEHKLADDEIVKNAQSVVDEAQAALGSAQRELNQVEDEVTGIQSKLKENQNTLYGGKVRVPKELQDLQLEAESLTKHIKALEDTELEKMMALEERQTSLQTAETELEAIVAQRAVENRTLGNEQTKLLGEAERLQEERSTDLGGISTDDLKIYDNLRSTKGGMAVAKVQNKTCSACGAELSASLAQAARSPNELAHCDSCKRILYSG